MLRAWDDVRKAIIEEKKRGGVKKTAQLFPQFGSVEKKKKHQQQKAEGVMKKYGLFQKRKIYPRCSVPGKTSIIISFSPHRRWRVVNCLTSDAYADT